MDWQGGFGDALSVDEVLRVKEKLLYHMAYERVYPEDVEDAVQEARITIWQVIEAKPDASPAYLHGAARNRMKSYHRDRKPTGAPSHQGRQQVVEAASLDIIRDAAFGDDHDPEKDIDATLLTIAQEVLDSIEIAYHRGEILKAINSLSSTHRAYIWHRFWHGLNNAEIAAKVGIRQDSLGAMWNQRTKPALALQLSHLATV